MEREESEEQGAGATGGAYSEGGWRGKGKNAGRSKRPATTQAGERQGRTNQSTSTSEDKRAGQQGVGEIASTMSGASSADRTARHIAPLDAPSPPPHPHIGASSAPLYSLSHLATSSPLQKQDQSLLWAFRQVFLPVWSRARAKMMTKWRLAKCVRKR